MDQAAVGFVREFAGSGKPVAGDAGAAGRRDRGLTGACHGRRDLIDDAHRS